MKVKITRSGYDPKGPRVNDPTLEPAPLKEAVAGKNNRRKAGDLRTLAAQLHLSEAHNEVLRAMQDLSSVMGFTSEWRELNDLSRKLNSVRYGIRDKADTVHADKTGELDRDVVQPAERSMHAGCGLPRWKARKQ